MLNSEALRASYNACLPLLSAYQTDLAQSEPLYRAYRSASSKREGAALGAGRAPRGRARAARLPPRGRRARCRAQAPLQGRDAGADAAAGEVRRERARRHQRAGRITSPTRTSCAASTKPSSSRRASVARRSKNLDGWLLTLDQPTYVAVVTDAEHEPLRRTRSTKPGPRARPIAARTRASGTTRR